MNLNPLLLHGQLPWAIAFILTAASPGWAQIGSSSSSLVTSAGWTNDLGYQTFQYTVNVSAAMPAYLSTNAGGNLYQLSSTLGVSVQPGDSSGDIAGDGVLFFGQGGMIGDGGSPFTSTISIAGPDYFSTGTYIVLVDDYAASSPVPFSFDVTGGPASLAITPNPDSSIGLAPAPEGTNGMIQLQDMVTVPPGDSTVLGVFGDQDSVALQDFSVYLSPGGGELGTVTLNIPVQGDRAWSDALTEQLDQPAYLGTLTLPLTYVRGDNIPQPSATISASTFSINDGDQSTLTVTVQNQSQVVSLASGQVLLDTNSLGGLAIIGDPSQPLGEMAPQSSANYTFTVQGAFSGSFNPQVIVTNGQWGWPAGAKESFTVAGQLASNILVTLPAPTVGAASGVTSSGFAANWSNVSGATGYLLDVSTDIAFGSYVTGYADLDVGSATSQAVTGLNAGVQYYYRVWAYDSGGTSASSDVASTTTLSRIISLGGNLTFGYITTNTTAQTNLTIYNTGNTPMTVTGISYPGGFSGNWSGTIAAGNLQVVAVTFLPTAGTSYGGSVTVSSDATSGVNTISASGTGATRLISLSGNLAFGSVTTNASAQTNLTISNTGNSTMTVSSISYSTNVFSGSWSGQIPAGNSTNVTVKFSPTSGVSYSGTVTVNSDATSGANTISASGTGATRLISLSGNLAFGSVTTNSSAQTNLTIGNTGNSTMTVSSISYSTNVFSGSWSGQIPAGNSTNVTVKFSPTSGVSYSGTATVNSDATSGANTISASGTGVSKIISLTGSMAFGYVTVGTSSNKTLTIKNTGTATMTVSSISYSTSVFSGSWSGHIPAGNSTERERKVLPSFWSELQRHGDGQFRRHQRGQHHSTLRGPERYADHFSERQPRLWVRARGDIGA